MVSGVTRPAPEDCACALPMTRSQSFYSATERGALLLVVDQATDVVARCVACGSMRTIGLGPSPQGAAAFEMAREIVRAADDGNVQ